MLHSETIAKRSYRRAHQNNNVIDWWWRRRWTLFGRHSCTAQGASPRLDIDIHFFEPRRGGTTPKQVPHNTRAVSAAPQGAHFTFICRYPGFHIGLCPHSTLGYAGVSCLKALVISLNFGALALTPIQGKRYAPQKLDKKKLWGHIMMQ